MGKTAIISDSTCDLGPALVQRYGITIVPLHIILGEKEYSDGVDITPDEIYKWSDENNSTPKTSAPSLEAAQEAISSCLKCHDEVVAFCISETMSASGKILRVAAEELGVSEKVFVIDSKNLSTGIGLQVIEAAVMAENGASAQEIVKAIAEISPMVRASFVVDTLTFLHRGGRCSGLAAMAGSALKLHPMISVVDGNMGAGKKYRGKLEKAISQYVEDLMPEIKKARPERIFVTHSGCEREIVEKVKAQLEELGIFDEIHETLAGGVVSSHCGPGTLGVLFIAG